MRASISEELVTGMSSCLGISDGWRFYEKRRGEPSPYHSSFTIARQTAEGTRCTDSS